MQPRVVHDHELALHDQWNAIYGAPTPRRKWNLAYPQPGKTKAAKQHSKYTVHRHFDLGITLLTCTRGPPRSSAVCSLAKITKVGYSQVA